MLERSNEFTLYYLNQKLRDDLVLSEDALNKLLQIESQQPEFLRSTYTLATSAAGLINHWLVERKLPCYRRGRAIDDVTAELVTVLDDDIGRAIDSDDASVSIKRDDFLSLLKEEGVPAPSFILDTARASENDTPEQAAPRLLDKPEQNPTDEKASSLPQRANRGIAKHEILKCDWPIPGGAPSLESILDKRPKWVEAACIRIGRPGKGPDGSHLWNPAMLAVCLAERTPHKKWVCNKQALSTLIRASYPDYLEEWQLYGEYL